MDTAAKNEIRGIMKKKRVTFDQARTLYLQQKMAKNGIGADGRPLGVYISGWTYFMRRVKC